MRAIIRSRSFVLALAIMLLMLPLVHMASAQEATPEVTPEGTPEATPEATEQPGTITIRIIIEGPVEAINVNIITIYNINIEVEPGDPVLNIIQIGDWLHVEGDLVDSDSPNIVIVAVTIVLIGVDVVFDDNGTFVWRDSGNCGNPPPPWAPANGWRARCESSGSGGGGGSGGSGGGKVKIKIQIKIK